MASVLTRLLRHHNANTAWAIVRAGAKRHGIDARALGRIREMIFAGAGALPAHPDDPRQKSPMYMHGLTARPWHDADAFEELRALRAAAGTIHDEAIRAWAERRYHRRRAERIVVGGWQACFLRYLGRPMAENCRFSPVTADLLERTDEGSSLGLAYFCALEPGSRLEPHGSQSNVVLRAQITLEASDECMVRVAGSERRCRAGDCLVFDESYESEQSNDGSSTRFALAIDVWHPDLRPEEIVALDLLSKTSVHAWRRRRAAARAVRTGEPF